MYIHAQANAYAVTEYMDSDGNGDDDDGLSTYYHRINIHIYNLVVADGRFGKALQTTKTANDHSDHAKQTDSRMFSAHDFWSNSWTRSKNKDTKAGIYYTSIPIQTVKVQNTISKPNEQQLR